jgi:hypothetical protein
MTLFMKRNRLWLVRYNPYNSNWKLEVLILLLNFIRIYHLLTCINV